MASTNKTTHYELSQYVSSDKPTYLVDYNGDMAKIDTAINAAKTTADGASTAATNAASDAANAQSTANTAVTNAASAQTSADSANTKIGELANLETTAKSNIVSAVNEVNTIANTSEVIDNMTGNETNKAPSVRSTKNYIKGVSLYHSDSGSNSSINLSDSSANYDFIEIEFITNDGANYKASSGKVKNPNNAVISLIYMHSVYNNIYIKKASCKITNNTIEIINGVECNLTNGANPTVTQVDDIYITDVIGFKY